MKGIEPSSSAAKVDIDLKHARLRRELKATRRTLTILQARQSSFPLNLERWLDEAQKGGVEYEASSERLVIRPAMHPDAAQALHAFAARVVGIDDAAVH